MAGSLPEKSVGEPTNICPFSVIRVVMLACGLNGHFATPLSYRVTFRFSIWNMKFSLVVVVGGCAFNSVYTRISCMICTRFSCKFQFAIGKEFFVMFCQEQEQNCLRETFLT